MRYLLLCSFLTTMDAQQVFERGGHVMYEDSAKERTDLGEGFNPILMSDGKVALIRGHGFGYGEDFDCRHRATKNWVVLYDPGSQKSATIFNRALTFDRGGNKLLHLRADAAFA